MPEQDIEGVVVSSSADGTIANLALACLMMIQPDLNVDRAVFTVVMMIFDA